MPDIVITCFLMRTDDLGASGNDDCWEKPKYWDNQPHCQSVQ
jgi:hypothetical protein